MEVMVTTWAISRAKLPSNHHHQQTNTQLFTGQMPFLSPNQQCRSTGGNCFMPTACLVLIWTAPMLAEWRGNEQKTRLKWKHSPTAIIQCPSTLIRQLATGVRVMHIHYVGIFKRTDIKQRSTLIVIINFAVQWCRHITEYQLLQVVLSWLWQCRNTQRKYPGKQKRSVSN